MLHLFIHTFIQIIPFLSPFVLWFIYFSCFTDLAREKISVFWCTFLKCKTRKRLNWIFFCFKEEKQTRYQKLAFLSFFFTFSDLPLFHVHPYLLQAFDFFFPVLQFSNLYSSVTSMSWPSSCQRESQCV